jgi:hypothetical protein
LYDTSPVEIRALIGLWLKLGTTGFHNSSVDEIFSAKKSSSLYAHLCFGRDRYKILMRALRFDDKTKRLNKSNNKWADKLVHIREIFARNWQDSYNPNECLTVDEMLLPFRGRCSFRMFIPSKAAKFGIKIFCAVDPKTMYLVNSSIYLGKSDSSGDKNLGEKIVMDLSSKFQNAGRIIVTDNFFTSSELGQSLLKKRTQLLGTIRRNRQGNPKDFIGEKVEVGKTKYVFR